MKKCDTCNIEMIQANLHGEPFTMELDHEVDNFSVRIKDESKNSSFLGMKFPGMIQKKINTLVCPKCGKVEFYIEPLIKE